VPFLLVPAALSKHPEVVGHLTQILLLWIALYVTALIGLRLGLDQRGAVAAVLLTAATPAVLGMAGTVMPDIGALAYTVLAVERILAWRQDRKWHQAAAAAIWLSLDILTRVHTVLLLASALVFLLNGIRFNEIRSSFTNFRTRYLPLLLVPVLCLVVLIVTADPVPPNGVDVDQSATAHRFVMNLCAFFAHWVVVVPLAIPWLLLRGRQIPLWLTLGVALPAALVATRFGWVALVAALGGVVLADIAIAAIAKCDRDQLGLFLWLLPALAPALYLHLPCKYVVPSVPAAAILLARLLPAVSVTTRRFLIPATAAAGIAISLLVLTGTRSLALAQKRAVDELIAPRVQVGQRVLFAGQWGFSWYAQAAGASPATWMEPYPRPGDIVVVSLIDPPVFAQQWPSHKVLERWSENQPGGRVLDRRAGAGFFSNGFGNLPWTWSNQDNNRFEVWEVE
jgi:hypothetical protein